MEGYLEKWTHAFGGWHKRYFVLSGNVLMYSNEKGKPRKGIIPLEAATVSDKGEYRFDVDASSKVLYIRTPDCETKEMWINAIRTAKAQESSKNFSKISVIPAAMRAHLELETVQNQSKSNKELSFRETEPHNKNFEDETSNASRINTMQVLLEDLKSNNEKLMKIKTKDKSDLQQIWYDNLKKIMELEHLMEITRLSLTNNRMVSSNSCDSVKLIESTNGVSDYKIPETNAKSSSNNNATKKEKSKFNNSSHDVRINDKISKFGEQPNNFETRSLNNEPRLSVIRKDTDVFYAADDGDFDSNIDESCPIKPSFNNFNSNPQNFKEKIIIDEHDSNNFAQFSNNNFVQANGQETVSNTLAPFKSSRKVDFTDSAYNSKRTELNVPRVKVTFSVWSILKDAVGKDLNKFSVPVYFNEPISMIQRFCEVFQYADLLNRASKESNVAVRMGLLAAFVVAGFAMNPKRILKFFNPLLGETYEYIDNEQNFRYFGEQVSHHPAISAAFVEGEAFTYLGNMDVKTSFKLMRNCVEIENLKRSIVTFKNFNETISFSRPLAYARNLLGSTYIDCGGKFNITNHSTGETLDCKISDKKGKSNTFGEIKDGNGNKLGVVEGEWLSYINLTVEGSDAETVWKRATGPGDEDSRYYFTDFTMNLNNLNEELKKVIAPTDSRLRPDQRALENQNVDMAVAEKDRLEKKQREVRKVREQNKEDYNPVYFTQQVCEETGETMFVYTKDYWQDRKAHNFNHLPDIF